MIGISETQYWTLTPFSGFIRQGNLTPEAFMVMHFYGPVIDDALSSRKTSLDDLRVLRHHASAVLEAQGDLKKKLKTLDQEIKRREKTEKSS